LNYALRKGQIKALFLPGTGSKQEAVNKYQKVLAKSLEIPEDVRNYDFNWNVLRICSQLLLLFMI